MSWLTAEQALTLLGTKSQTLYANVSRGRIRAKPDPADSRRSLYFAEDVKRLAARQSGRRKTEAVAEDAIRWGDPVLSSAISTVTDGRLFYRGRDVVALSQSSTLEEAAALLWDTKQPLKLIRQRAASGRPVLADAFHALADRAPNDLPSLGRSAIALQAEAEIILSTVADALAPGDPDTPLHERLAASLGRPDAADIIRRALVLHADHELNASTFAARVTASAGATLSACVLSGLSTLTGPLHGGAWRGVSALIDSAGGSGARDTVQSYLARGQKLSGFGHPLYPDGDVRAGALLRHLPLPPLLDDIQTAVREMVGEQPNVDYATSSLATIFDLPKYAPLVIFALARTVGWLAHAIEQVNGGQLIRPRARYTGQPIAIAAAE